MCWFVHVVYLTHQCQLACCDVSRHVRVVCFKGTALTHLPCSSPVLSYPGALSWLRDDGKLPLQAFDANPRDANAHSAYLVELGARDLEVSDSFSSVIRSTSCVPGGLRCPAPRASWHMRCVCMQLRRTLHLGRASDRRDTAKGAHTDFCDALAIRMPPAVCCTDGSSRFRTLPC